MGLVGLGLWRVPPLDSRMARARRGQLPAQSTVARATSGSRSARPAWARPAGRGPSGLTHCAAGQARAT